MVMFRRGTFSSRICAWGLFLLLGLIVWDMTVLPAMDAFRERETKNQNAQLKLAKMLELVERRSDYRDALVKLNRQTAGRRAYIEAATVSQGQASLQKRLKQLLDNHGARIRSLRNVAAKSINDLEEIGVVVETEITAEGMTAFLYDVEYEWPLLRVGKLHIRARNSASTAEHSRQKYDVNANVTVKGYMRLRQ